MLIKRISDSLVLQLTILFKFKENLSSFRQVDLLYSSTTEIKLTIFAHKSFMNEIKRSKPHLKHFKKQMHTKPAKCDATIIVLKGRYRPKTDD